MKIYGCPPGKASVLAFREAVPIQSFWFSPRRWDCPRGTNEETGSANEEQNLDLNPGVSGFKANLGAWAAI